VNIARLLLIPIALSLFACASQEPKPPKTTDAFTTLIQADGSKQFSYTLIMEMPEHGGGGHSSRAGQGMEGKGPGGHGGPPPGGGGKKGQGKHGAGKHGPRPDDEGKGTDGLTHLTEEGLLAKLEDSGYCRNSYRTLNTDVKHGAMNIQGECYDKATDAERKQFPNPQPKKVVEERLN